MTRKILSLLLVLMGLWNTLMADHLSSNLLFTARLIGDNEVPAVTTNGQGLGIFTFDEKKSTLYINVSLTNLSGPITGIHIHEGEEGANGPVIYNLTPFLQGNRLKGMIPNVTRASFAKFISGDYYINAHTELHPGGEIRGQIALETDYRFSARLSGSEEVPAVSTTGKGIFIANLSQSGSLVNFHMVFEGLSSPVTGAHIHQAPAGTNGGVVFNLGPFLFGNTVSGTWDAAGFADALRAGELYVNVHTVNHPGGEIRGQLVLEEGLMFDAILDGDNENPPVGGAATGVALITVSPDLSTLHYHIITDSLTGNITGAHFHSGVVGTNGGVVIDLSDNINGNIISGTAPLSLDLLNRMLEGRLYINVHTDANPGGELRGQVLKLAREGFLFDLNGGQEVPPVTTTGTGAGIVSIDRDQTNAHYMIVYSGLVGTFTASHFHNGSPGENGGVLFDISSSFNDGGAFGYWDSSFDQNTSRLFRENEIYVNVHSTLFPGGEIRGNVVRASDLFTHQPFDPKFGNNFMLFAQLSGAAENPPVPTNALGVATFYFGADRTTAEINVTVSGLSGPITGAHIHEGFPGMNGPVVFPLTFEGNRIHAEVTGITSEQLGKFISEGYYINVHTAAHPGGEIRGQIFIDQDATFVATLSGTQEVPPVATDARGLGAFHYTWGSSDLDVNVQVTELSSDITGAHLHLGAPGQNGGVIFDLGPLRDGNRIQGTLTGLTAVDINSILSGNVYVNVHTTNNPGGEIRGQLIYQNGLTFDGWMSGTQEVPFATTPGTGLAVATLTPDLTNVDFWMVTDDLSGDASAAHFHRAPVGENGGVVLDLSSGLNDNDISFSGPVSDAVVDALLTGSIYVNVHTPAFPGGELRGQLFRLARNGYGFDLCPEQEVGTVNAPTATGSALVSIDRLHSNINLLFQTDGLTGNVNSAHIHQAPQGMNGGVILDLTPVLFNGGVSVFGATIDTAIIESIIDGITYINAHTALHPAGEVRGQIVPELLCSIPTGINELEAIVANVLLSPVPVDEQLNVTIESLMSTNLTLTVFDLSGKILSTNKFDMTQGENTVRIETAVLSPGFYMLMISDGNASQAFKFVK